jgi:hypothetical protein
LTVDPSSGGPLVSLYTLVIFDLFGGFVDFDSDFVKAMNFQYNGMELAS